MPGNDIHVRTVADKIILTGSVASAGEAQKALDIASGFIGNSAPPARPAASAISISGGSSGSASNGSRARPPASDGKVINSLTIRGLDQVSLRVTVTEIRRDIIKQLGVNMSGSGIERRFDARQPIRRQRRSHDLEATLGWVKGNQSLQRDACKPSSGKASRTRSPSRR